jgi:predicted N-acetyltransferase YhbS
VTRSASAAEFGVAEARDAPALAELFERAELGCYCRYWNFSGDKNDWLARVAFEPETNRRELTDELSSPDVPLSGVVARAERRVIGWMKILALPQAHKIHAQKLYRGLPCFSGDRTGGFVIGCFLVDPSERRQGIARGLLQAGVEAVRARGGRFIEAFPRRAELAGDAEFFMGPFSVFEGEGFQAVNDFGPYPVLRLVLQIR